MANLRDNKVSGYRYGECHNEQCVRFNDKKPIEIPSRKPFECPDCHKPLYETAPPGNKIKPLPWILGGIGVCALAFFIVWAIVGNKKHIEIIEINPTNIELRQGENSQLIAKVTPENADYGIDWTSSNPEVATVDQGVVTAVSPGEAQISAVAQDNNEILGSAKIVVTEDRHIQGISLDNNAITLNEGESITLTPEVTPQDAGYGIDWTSSNPHVAVVENGKVMAVGAGDAEVKAIAQDNNSIFAVAKVKVNKGKATPEKDGGETPGNPTPGEPNTVNNKNLGYGIYSGGWKNGKPHGTGTLVYKQAHVMSPYDLDKLTAQPGETYQGGFVNGVPTIGKLFNANGSLKKAINFGSAI